MTTPIDDRHRAGERPRDVLRDLRRGAAAGAAARRLLGDRLLVRCADPGPGRRSQGRRVRVARPRAHGRHRPSAEQRGHGRRRRRRDRQLGLGPVDLYGYSMGAFVALLVTLRHPAAGAQARVHVGDLHHERRPSGPDGRPGRDDARDDAWLAVARGVHAASRRAPRTSPRCSRRRPRWTGATRTCATRTSQAIEAPTLVIIGDSDLVRPEHAVEMFRLLGGGVFGDMPPGLPASQLAVLPGTSHVSIVFRADLLVPIVTASSTPRCRSAPDRLGRPSGGEAAHLMTRLPVSWRRFAGSTSVALSRANEGAPLTSISTVEERVSPLDPAEVPLGQCPSSWAFNDHDPHRSPGVLRHTSDRSASKMIHKAPTPCLAWSGKSNRTTTRRAGQPIGAPGTSAPTRAGPCRGRDARERARSTAHPTVPIAAITSTRSRPALLGRYTKSAAVGVRRRPRPPPPVRAPGGVSSGYVRGIARAPRRRSPSKVVAPCSRFRTMIGVHRSARISEARAIGQYWP